jgi:hypothetical protein
MEEEKGIWLKHYLKNETRPAQWLKHVILATQEMEIGRISV